MTDSPIGTTVENLCNIVLKSEEFWEVKNKAVLQLNDLVSTFHDQTEDVINESFTANVFRLFKEPVKVMVSFPLHCLNIILFCSISDCRFAISTSSRHMHLLMHFICGDKRPNEDVSPRLLSVHFKWSQSAQHNYEWLCRSLHFDYDSEQRIQGWHSHNHIRDFN
jgi:hypothetical protein